jgi:hypothetical protein
MQETDSNEVLYPIVDKSFDHRNGLNVFIGFYKYRGYPTFEIDLVGLPKEERIEARDLFRAFVEVYYTEVYKKSEQWQASNERWKHKTRKWGIDFEDIIKSYINGKERYLYLPPDARERSKKCLLVGKKTFTARAEKSLMSVFIQKAIPILLDWAERHGYVVRRGRIGKPITKDNWQKVFEL